ncbi:MAG: DnaJ domain-containing protein [Dehalococcoidales bacterium]|nr:DnaJ domain-containing protein [Dehalococcoidales bacterium]
MDIEYKVKRRYRYYEALGLKKGAPVDAIKKSYRMLVKKYHPDINNDPRASEILKKLNEAYSILSNPETRLIYDNSEAECPRCWTHEVRRIKGENFTTYQWACKHCGCNFQFLKYAKEETFTEEEKKFTYRKFKCPQCKRELEFDTLILLYRCKNKRCRRVYTYKELCKYYGIKPETPQTEKEKKEVNPKTKEKTDSISQIGLAIFIFSLILNIILLYNMVSSYSLLYLGLFLFLVAFSLLSLWVYKNPAIVRKIIKALTVKK